MGGCSQDLSTRHWPADLQQVPPTSQCAQCGGEIYPGDAAWTDCPALGYRDGVDLHAECLLDWVRDQGTTTMARAFGFRQAG